MKKFLKTLGGIFTTVILAGLGYWIVISPQQSQGKVKSSEYWFLVQGSVYDGDTIRVRQTAGEERKIRFACIDAPELNQPKGKESRDYLRSLLPTGTPLALTFTDKDRYGRHVAEVFVTGQTPEIFVQEEMLKAGLAYAYEQYKDDCPNYDSVEVAESIAKNKKAGVWSDPNSVLPWEYRKSK